MSTPAEKINALVKPRQLRREWTPARKRAVVRYYAKHGSKVTQDKFRVSGSMLTRWRDEAGPPAKKPSAKKRRRLKTISHPHGMGAPAKTNVHDAVVYLEHAEAAARTSGKQWTKAELFALLALHTLRGD